MQLAWPVDEIVRTSDETAVRKRFDERNLFWLIVLLCVFAFVSFLEIVANTDSKTPFEVWIALVNAVLVAFGLFVVRYAWRVDPVTRAARTVTGRWVRDHVSATTLTYIALQYPLLLAFTSTGDNWMAWAAMFPFMMLQFRMPVAELVLMHAYLAAGGIVMALIFGFNGPLVAWIAAMLVTNAMVLGFELWASHRMRKKVRGEWTERRAQAREQIRMRDELRYARELQLSMLPECAPQLDWLDICAISLPATEVGGDYYDYFIEPHRVALVCGDVAGHGMASGLVLSAIRSGFTLLRDLLDNPASVLRRLHDLVAETSRRRMLVTVSVVLLDRVRRRAIIASAGHPPVIIRRAHGSIEVVELWAPPLGVRLPVDIPQRDFAIAEGDLYVLHSDGIYETRNAAGEAYGIDRLVAVIRSEGTGSAETVRDSILRDVAAFRGAEEMDDDVTLVVARIR